MSAASTPPRSAAPRTRSGVGREAVELLSSMRFAIALLSIICIASVIGTVVQQGQPSVNYVNQFGPFWSQVFAKLDLYTVYSAWWFLLILAFLVVSTSLCIARNLPKIIVDVRTFKEQVREQSLAAHHHKAQGQLPQALSEAVPRLTQTLAEAGWQTKLDVRANGTMLAAKKGSANKIAYLLAHSAIVLICLGGLADGDLIVRIQMWVHGLTPTPGGPSAMAAEHRMPVNNPAFRGNLRVSEGQASSLAVLNLPQGMLIQPLPFEIELKQFKVEYYSTGMPKLFASDIVIHDPQRGVTLPATVEVNHPVIYRGVAIYQSSFEDGGSQVKLRAWPLGAAVGPAAAEVVGEVGTVQPLPPALSAGQDLTLELTDLRVINVENLGPLNAGVDVRRVDLVSTLEQHLGAGHKSTQSRDLKNVGPAISYKLRDAAGQAREFQNYMVPADLDGLRVFLFGQRETPSEPFRFLRIPADERDQLNGWINLRAALADEGLRREAVRRYVAIAAPPNRPDLLPQLSLSATRALGLFAGVLSSQPNAAPTGGLQALSDFIEANVPVEEQMRASEVLVRIVDGTLFELLNLSRERAGLAPRPQDEASRAFMTQAVLSLSDAFFYQAPAFLTLSDFRQVQASVFQVARAPGKTVVYLGCALLVLGVFAMLFIRERRIWIWLQPGPQGGTALQCAMSSTRQTLDLDREFTELSAALLADGSPAAPHS